MNSSKKKETEILIVSILEEDEFKEGLSTAEIITEIDKISSDCKDKIPSSLLILFKKGFITKEISKKRKSIIWKLTNY